MLYFGVWAVVKYVGHVVCKASNALSLVVNIYVHVTCLQIRVPGTCHDALHTRISRDDSRDTIEFSLETLNRIRVFFLGRRLFYRNVGEKTTPANKIRNH